MDLPEKWIYLKMDLPEKWIYLKNRFTLKMDLP
jgi:hypothetical protein